MPTIPAPEQVTQDIFSFGFGKTLTRALSVGLPRDDVGSPPVVTSGSIVYNSVSEMNAASIQSGTRIGGWTIGDDRLYNKNITLDAEIGKITLGSQNIVLDASNERIIINDGTDDRVLIGKDVGGF